MTRPRVMILRAPGTNCDRETAFAFELAGAEVDVAHINRLLESPRRAEGYQILCLPGGFSYGDDIAAGRILANQVRHHLAEALRQFHQAGKLILGICNGFQVLIQTGLLLENDAHGQAATLTENDSGHFEDRWVHLRVDGDRCVFLRDVERMYLPVAHAEGKFVFRDQATRKSLAAQGRLVLRYAAPGSETGGGAGGGAEGRESLPYPCNPNGSMADVAGVCDATGRVFGLMPHPERFVDPTHHPHWTRRELPEDAAGEGLALFRNAVDYFRD